jgi:aspartate racemase
MKKIWILWGMWPQASIDFYRMLIEKSHMYNLWWRNQDYPAIVLSNIPVPDQIKWENDIHIALDMINREAKALEKTWAKFLVMPCNTMHLFIEDIMHWIKIPFISMIESVVEQIKKSGFKKIWLLWSTTTMKSHLYISPLNNLGIKIIIPEKEKHDSISQTIHNYIAWKSNQKDVKLLEKYSNELVESWAEVIILWCTELPLILKNSLWKYNFLASSEILAEKTIQYSQT